MERRLLHTHLLPQQPAAAQPLQGLQGGRDIKNLQVCQVAGSRTAVPLQSVYRAGVAARAKCKACNSLPAAAWCAVRRWTGNRWRDVVLTTDCAK